MVKVQSTAAILGLGSYVPEKRLANQDFEKALDTSDEWITTRTGIKSRRVAAPEQSTSHLGLRAAQAALADAHVQAADLDLILVATFSPDYLMPATACLLQEKLGLGARGTPALDLNGACTGFLYGLATAKAFVESGQARHVLMVGAEVCTRFLNYTDRTSCILFGDGAGAAVVGLPAAGRPSHAIRSVRLWADGRGQALIQIPAGGSAQPASAATVAAGAHTMRVSGREVYRFAVTKFVEMTHEALAAHKLKLEDLGKIVPHQANSRILSSAAERLGLTMDRFVVNLAEYGNTSAASVPLALDEAHRAGQLPSGKPVLLLAFGAGLTWASAVIEW